MAVTQGLGAVLAVSAAAPATEDETGYDALTWTDVGEATEIPNFGPSHAVVNHTPLATGIIQKYHGELNYGSITLPMALVRADAGQVILKTALASKTRISFRITYADGSEEFIQGKVMSFMRGASVGAVIPAEAQIEFETALVEVAA